MSLLMLRVFRRQDACFGRAVELVQRTERPVAEQQRPDKEQR